MSGAQRVATQLTGTAKDWFSWEYEIRDEGKVVATLQMEWIAEHGALTIAGRNWELGREGWYSGAYFVKQAGRLAATAEKPSALFRHFQVRIGQDTYSWRSDSAFTRSFVLLDGDRSIGSMRAVNVFTRDATIDLPDDLSLEQKAFLVWIALLMWRRQKK